MPKMQIQTLFSAFLQQLFSKNMKTNSFALLLIAFSFNLFQSHATPAFNAALYTPQTIQCAANNTQGGDPIDIKVVVSQKRIWLVADEMPMKCLKTVVKNSIGEVVLEKCFTSKCADWFLNIEALPKGDYTLHLGEKQVESFKK